MSTDAAARDGTPGTIEVQATSAVSAAGEATAGGFCFRARGLPLEAPGRPSRSGDAQTAGAPAPADAQPATENGRGVDRQLLDLSPRAQPRLDQQDRPRTRFRQPRSNHASARSAAHDHHVESPDVFRDALTPTRGTRTTHQSAGNLAGHDPTRDPDRPRRDCSSFPRREQCVLPPHALARLVLWNDLTSAAVCPALLPRESGPAGPSFAAPDSRRPRDAPVWRGAGRAPCSLTRTCLAAISGTGPMLVGG